MIPLKKLCGYRTTHNYIRENMVIEQNETRVLHIWDCIANLHGKIKQLPENVILNWEQKNLSCESYYSIWKKFVDEVKKRKHLTRLDRDRLEEREFRKRTGFSVSVGMDEFQEVESDSFI